MNRPIPGNEPFLLACQVMSRTVTSSPTTAPMAVPMLPYNGVRMSIATIRTRDPRTRMLLYNRSYPEARSTFVAIELMSVSPT